MSTQLALGSEIQHNEKPHLVVRIVEKSIALFEEEDRCFAVEESYAELRGPNGEVDFITFLSTEQLFTTKSSQIKALPILPWRVRK